MSESERKEIMAKFKLGTEAHVSRISFEQLIIAAQQISLDWDFSKKFRVILDHDPDEATVNITYSLCE